MMTSDCRYKYNNRWMQFFKHLFPNSYAKIKCANEPQFGIESCSSSQPVQAIVSKSLKLLQCTMGELRGAVGHFTCSAIFMLKRSVPNVSGMVLQLQLLLHGGLLLIIIRSLTATLRCCLAPTMQT